MSVWFKIYHIKMKLNNLLALFDCAKEFSSDKWELDKVMFNGLNSDSMISAKFAEIWNASERLMEGETNKKRMSYSEDHNSQQVCKVNLCYIIVIRTHIWVYLKCNFYNHTSLSNWSLWYPICIPHGREWYDRFGALSLLHCTSIWGVDKIWNLTNIVMFCLGDINEI